MNQIKTNRMLKRERRLHNQTRLYLLLKMLDECITQGSMDSNNTDKFDDSFLLPWLNFPGTYYDREQRVREYRSAVVASFDSCDHLVIWQPPHFRDFSVTEGI